MSIHLGNKLFIKKIKIKTEIGSKFSIANVCCFVIFLDYFLLDNIINIFFHSRSFDTVETYLIIIYD